MGLVKKVLFIRESTTLIKIYLGNNHVEMLTWLNEKILVIPYQYMRYEFIFVKQLTKENTGLL